MINFDALDFDDRRSEENNDKFPLTLSVSYVCLTVHRAEASTFQDIVNYV